jgi:hypothetical protein
MLVKNFVVFPLTLTLSLEEREQPLGVFVKPVCHAAEVRHRFTEVFERGTKARRDYARTPGAIPPLPGGEGRGEGNHPNAKGQSLWKTTHRPLTLTLSLEEREQLLDVFVKPVYRAAEVRHRCAEVFKRGTKARRDYAKTPGAIPPLRRGEGKVHVKMPAVIVCPISSKACL